MKLRFHGSVVGARSTAADAPTLRHHQGTSTFVEFTKSCAGLKLTYRARITRSTTARRELSMKLSVALAIGGLFAAILMSVATKTAIAADDEQALLQIDRAAFGSGTSSIKQNNNLLDPNFTWTDSFGNTRNKLEIVQDLSSGKG